MKKWNKNTIVFVLSFLFLFLGMRGSYIHDMKKTLHSFADHVGKKGIYQSFVDYKNHMEEISETSLSYHGRLMDINSVRENLMGTRLIKKDNTMVVKTNTGSLVETNYPLSGDEISQVADRIKDLKDYSEKHGAHFMYLAAPRKELAESRQSMPPNADNHAPANMKLFFQALEDRDIPYLSLLDAISERGIGKEDIFFYTDHHWTPYAGFLAADCICRDLNRRYGFKINEKYGDIRNYNRKIYPNWFLGSKGKKTGTWFTWRGPDDFELITPRFKTHYMEEQPIKKKTRKGSFEKTALYMKNLKKDFYKVNSYVTYGGGDYRLQILTNQDNLQGKKVLLLRDSYACVVSPFLSLQTSRLYVCDIRNFDYFVGDRIDIAEFMEEYKPDYVLVLYSGIVNLQHSDGKYDFFK